MELKDQARRAARTQDERCALIMAVADAGPGELKQDWVAWRTGVDLSRSRWHAEIAAQVTGLANRHPDAARHQAEGCGYLLCGVEPGNIEGVTPVDLADMTNGVRRYVDGPRWNPAYEVVGDRTVLVITVEPPAWGDPIHSLRQEFAEGNVRFGEGAYIRRPGQLDEARHADLEMLQERLVASPQLDLELAWLNAPEPLVAAACTGEQEEAWIEAEEHDLLSNLERRQGGHYDLSLAALAAGHVIDERRSVQSYRQEVGKYLKTARASLRPRLVSLAVGRSSFLRLGIVNPTDRNYSGVQAELLIDGTVAAFFEDDEKDILEGWPSRPWPFGRAQKPPRSVRARTLIPPVAPGASTWFRGHIEVSASTKVTFAPENVRPRQQEVALAPVRILAVGDWKPGDSITASWQLTARDASGVASGSMELRVGDQQVDPNTLRQLTMAEETRPPPLPERSLHQ